MKQTFLSILTISLWSMIGGNQAKADSPYAFRQTADQTLRITKTTDGDSTKETRGKEHQKMVQAAVQNKKETKQTGACGCRSGREKEREFLPPPVFFFTGR